MIPRVLRYPRFDTEEKTLAARTLHWVALTIPSCVAVQLLILVLFEPHTLGRRLVSIGITFAVAFVTMTLNHRGHTRAGSIQFVASYMALITWRAVSSGGVSAPVALLYLVFILVAGLLLGTRAGAITAAASSAAMLAMLFADVAGVLPPQVIHFAPQGIWVYATLSFTIAVIVQHQVAGTLRAALVLAQRAQKRLRLALDAGELAVWDNDVERERITADASLLALYGLTPDADGAFSRAAWAERVHPDDRADAVGSLKELQGGAPNMRRQFRVVREDGTVRHIETAGIAEFDANGKLEHVVGVNRDITAIKNAEREREALIRELREHKEHLEEVVATRTAELRTAKDEAEKANNAKSVFLATMSHEIRTPMNAIMGYAQILKRDATLDAAQKKKVSTIVASGDHLLTLINQVLEMARIESGHTTLVPLPFDLHAMLDDVLRMFTPLAATHNVAVSIERAASVPRAVTGDVGRVRQVVANLVGNAVKFTKQGAITIAVDARADDGGHVITIAVKDTGVGIAESDLARVFGVFEQTAAGTRAGGSGLGLAISRDLVHLMGGDITVTSELGKGSVFTMTFRAASAAAVPVEDARQVVGIDLHGERPKILIVDDEEHNRETAKELLVHVGFDVRTADSGEQALELHAEWAPRLIVIDIRMPGMGGFEAIRRLRARGTATKIIAFTASGLDDSLIEAQSAGADAGLLKPYKEHDLLKHVGTLLGVDFTYAEHVPPTDTPIVDPAALFSSIPPDLLVKLRAAAVEARPAHIARLADEIGAHSSDAAVVVRELAGAYRYDDLVAHVTAALG